MRDYFYFAGKSILDFGAYITDAGVYERPDRNYEKVSVPGRNGDLLIENDNYPNVRHTYPVIIMENFDENYDALMSFLLTQKGYQRLSDSFHPDEYYMATFVGVENLTHTIAPKSGKFNLVFDRKPQRFLKSGDQKNAFKNSGIIKNPTLNDTRPLIRVYTTGTYAVGDNSFTITDMRGHSYIDIDCDMQEAYSGDDNCNDLITLTDGKFPKLASGNNEINVDDVHYDGVVVTFNDQCRTETKYLDFVQIFYQENGTWYGSEKLGGDAPIVNNIAGAKIYVPSITFRLYFRTDAIVRLWGFKVDSVVEGSGISEFTVAELPSDITWTPIQVGIDDLPESDHPYANNESIGYEITGYTDGTKIDIIPRWWKL